jgi:transcriptional regulator with AAA-type ATPase domain
LGESDERTINARFIAAIQPGDLKEKILPDLKYRFRYPDTINVPTLYKRMQINPHGVIESAFTEAKRTMGFKEDFTIPDETVSLLSKFDYEGNFRQLRVILEAGMRAALKDKRTEILEKDVINFLRADTEAQYKEDVTDLDAIKLKDIFDYAENIKIGIIKRKVAGMLRSGKDIKTTLSGEGLNNKDYQNYRKKFKTMTGKGFSDML